MLSDEEKKAIEYIRNCLDNKYDFKNATRNKDIKYHSIALNLIEKQSKEIEELKEKCKKKNKTIETMQFIKAIQREQENILLITEEQCAIKNKYMLEVSNGEFVDANKLYSIWKNSVSVDKIKAKIEPVLKQLKIKMNEEYNRYGNSSDYQNMVDAYNFLESLIEKE